MQGRLTGYPDIPIIPVATLVEQPVETPSVGDVRVPGWALAGSSLLALLLVGSGLALVRRRS